MDNSESEIFETGSSKARAETITQSGSLHFNSSVDSKRNVVYLFSIVGGTKAVLFDDSIAYNEFKIGNSTYTKANQFVNYIRNTVMQI